MTKRDDSRPAEALEPAIPQHLRVDRTQPLSTPKNFTPAHASYSARFDPRVKCLPMIYLGVQAKVGINPAAAILNLRSGLVGRFGPSHFDKACFVDACGYSNTVFVGYWDDRMLYERWNASLSPDWWHRDLSVNGDVGAFREAFTPAVIDTETTFSHPNPEGYATIADRMSGKTDTHEYWGSARDRIPRAQIETLKPEGKPSGSKTSTDVTLARHIEITPHQNLCLLRSGQDWSETEGAERAFYLEQVRPHLEKGMREIERDGLPLGCYFNRYMTIEETKGPIEKTYSVSAWHSLTNLEAWVKADTHLAIWAAGIKHYKLAGDEARLRLYHELMILKADDQSFGYFNCHRDTGMLRSAGD